MIIDTNVKKKPRDSYSTTKRRKHRADKRRQSRSSVINREVVTFHEAVDWLSSYCRSEGLIDPVTESGVLSRQRIGEVFGIETNDGEILDVYFHLTKPIHVRPPRSCPLEKARSHNKSKPVAHVDVRSKKFMQTYEWAELRMVAFELYGTKCMCCGDTPENGAIMNVDHILPRRDRPDLALDINGLQILCQQCNKGKNNWLRRDYRSTEQKLAALEYSLKRKSR